MSANQPTSFRFPFTHPDPQTNQGFRLAFQGLKDHADAFAALKAQITNLTTEQQTINQTINQSIVEVTQTITDLPVNVTQQTGDYTLQQADYAGLNYFTGAGPYTVTLNNSITKPFWTSILNLSSAPLTVVANSPSTVNTLASITVDEWAVIFWDGALWWTMVADVWPVTKTSTSHQFLISYDATTGLFSAGQPAFSDISGVATALQTTHAEPLTDGNGNFVFAATLTTGGDIIVCEGIAP